MNVFDPIESYAGCQHWHYLCFITFVSLTLFLESWYTRDFDAKDVRSRSQRLAYWSSSSKSFFKGIKNLDVLRLFVFGVIQTDLGVRRYV